MKRTISLVLSLIILIGAFSMLPASAKKKSKTYKSGDFSYKILSDGTAMLTCYHGKKKTLNIPQRLGKRKVTQLGTYIVDSGKTKTVVIPKTVKSFCDETFINNGVKDFKVSADNKYFSAENGVLYNKSKSVIMKYPEGKKIGSTYTVKKSVKEIADRAFDSLKIKKVILPEGLIKIGMRSFGDCPMKSIEFPSTLQTIGELAFVDCPLESLTFPASLKTIGKRAFCYFDWDDEDNGKKSTLVSINLNDGLETIAKEAFSGTSLKTVTIPSTVKKIAYDAFECKKLTKYVVAESSPYYSADDGILYNKSKTKIICVPNGKKLTGKFTVADGVREINKYTFSDKGITELVLPDSVIKLGEESFYSCEKLKSVTFGSGLREIGMSCFENCEKLSKVNFNKGLKTIGERSFANCGLTSIDLKEGLETIKKEAFYINKIKSAKLPNTIKYLSGFGDTYLEEIDVPDSVEIIGEDCFSMCWNLKSIKLHNGLKKIGETAFFYCPIKTINIPSTVTQIDSDAFVETNLKEIKLPASLKHIEIAKSTFGSFPKNLKKLTISKSNKYYKTKDGVLYNKKMSEVRYLTSRYRKTYTTPKSVKRIAPQAFNDTNIKKVIVRGKVKTIPCGAFSNAYIDTVIFKKGVRTIKARAFDFSYVDTVRLPNTVKKINASAFSTCSLRKINIPKSVKSIGREAFFGTDLGKITVPPTVKKIGKDAIGILYGECGSYGGVNKNTVIRCKKNSAAYKYAKKQKVKYELY